MNVIALSAAAWTYRKDDALRLVQRLALADASDTIVVDRDTVERDSGRENSAGAAPVAEIAFGDWVKTGTSDGGVLDVHAVRGVAQAVPASHLVVVDARGHRPDLITAALGHLRHAWFHLDDWHRAFVVVFDDIHLLALAEALSQTFYCQPQLLTEVETNRLVRAFMRRASVQRWIGPGLARWHAWTLHRVQNRLHNIADRREERLERRG